MPALGLGLPRACRRSYAESSFRSLYSNNRFYFTSGALLGHFEQNVDPNMVGMISDLELGVRKDKNRGGLTYFNTRGPQLEPRNNREGNFRIVYRKPHCAVTPTTEHLPRDDFPHWPISPTKSKLVGLRILRVNGDDWNHYCDDRGSLFNTNFKGFSVLEQIEVQIPPPRARTRWDRHTRQEIQCEPPAAQHIVAYTSTIDRMVRAVGGEKGDHNAGPFLSWKQGDEGIWLRVSCNECGDEKLWDRVSRTALYKAEAEFEKPEGDMPREQPHRWHGCVRGLCRWPDEIVDVDEERYATLGTPLFAF